MKDNRYCFVFMGVSGCGKSAVAETVAKELAIPFLDGDFLHSRANIDKMASGQSLNDNDRKPWLEALNSAIYAMERTNKVSIIICSALKRNYRDVLRKDNTGLYFIYLQGNFNLISMRLKSRKGHFFKANMLESQFKDLEEPSNDFSDVCTISIDESLEEVVGDSIRFIKEVIGEEL